MRAYGASARDAILLEDRRTSLIGEERAGVRVGARADVVIADLEARDRDVDGTNLLLDVCKRRQR